MTTIRRKHYQFRLMLSLSKTQRAKVQTNDVIHFFFLHQRQTDERISSDSISNDKQQEEEERRAMDFQLN